MDNTSTPHLPEVDRLRNDIDELKVTLASTIDLLEKHQEALKNMNTAMGNINEVVKFLFNETKERSDV